MLRTEGIIKRYGAVRALSQLDLSVRKGALYGLLGQNGAGKTTLLRILCGLSMQDAGRIYFEEKDVTGRIDSVKHRIGYLPDYYGIYENMTLMEYLEFFASGYGITGLSAANRCRELLIQVGLIKQADSLTQGLSTGMRQRLCMARAMIHDPELILLDEPTNGMDPGTRFEFRSILQELCEEGKTILLSSHILSEVAELCTDIGIIDQGQMVVSGSINEIMSRIEKSNPIKITILDGISSAMAIFRENPCIKSITVHEKTFMIGFEGGRAEEAMLLQELINMEIPVIGFMREPGNLESFFIQITDHRQERTILQNDY